MKKLKLVAFTILCVFLLQILMPILMDINWNNVFAEDINIWDVSENGDGTVIATLSDDGTLNISGNGKMKTYGGNAEDYQNKRANIKKVVINKGVTSIGSYAFYDCENLSNIIIPEGVTCIGYCAFVDCMNLRNINIPNSVTSIGECAFEDCTSLSSITIPEGVTSIENDTFNWCVRLNSINIPKDVISIGESAFYMCESLSSITIPEGVTSIGDEAFSWCTNLSDINIPESVTSIGNIAFAHTSLKSINIPKGVTSIGKSVFEDCKSLISINVSKDNKNYISDNGVLYTKDKTSIIKYPTKKTDTEYTILEGVTSIEDGAFVDCPNLRSITIPEGVTSIGERAFFWCTSLSNINIPESVINIGYSSFWKCVNLNNITIPEGVTSIEGSTFEDCTSLRSITIPEGVTRIGDSAFNGCNKLIRITIPESVTSIGESAFVDCAKNLTIYCKKDSYAKKYAEEQKIRYILDDTAPTIINIAGNEKWTKDKITLTVSAKDESSGLANKAYSFDNGQTWQNGNTKIYTENVQGIVVKVRDALGNIATYKTIDINNVLKIEIKDYETIINRNEKYLTKINANTTISQLKEKIQTNGTVKILKGENEVTDSNTYVGTGMIIQVETEKYIAVVKGDLNGDGKIGLSDFTNIKFGLIGKKQLNTASQLAGDINGDGKMSLSDMTKLKMHLLGKVSI